MPFTRDSIKTLLRRIFLEMHFLRGSAAHLAPWEQTLCNLEGHKNHPIIQPYEGDTPICRDIIRSKNRLAPLGAAPRKTLYLGYVDGSNILRDWHSRIAQANDCAMSNWQV